MTGASGDDEVDAGPSGGAGVTDAAPDAADGGRDRRPPTVTAAKVVGTLIAVRLVVALIAQFVESSPEPEAVDRAPVVAPEATTPAPTVPDVPAPRRPLLELLRAEFGIDRIDPTDVALDTPPEGFLAEALTDHLDEDYGVDPAVTELFGDRTTSIVADEPFVERAETRVTDIGGCRLHHRRIRDVSVGIDGEPGVRIATQLRRASNPASFFDYEGSQDVFLHPEYFLEQTCEENLALGVEEFYVVEEIVPVPCELPGREVRCFALSRSTVRVGWTVSIAGFVVVFDRETGELVQRSDLVPGLTTAEVDRLVELVVRDRLTDLGSGDADEVFDSDPTTLGSLIPTADGLAYLELFWGLDTPIGLQIGQAIVSWDLVDRAVAHRAGLAPGERVDPVWGGEAGA